MKVRWLIAGLLAAVPSGIAHGQGGASTVQLPTFQFFTIDTTVWVPDAGTTVIGGQRPSSTGSTAFGPLAGPANRAAVAAGGMAQVGITAQVHDLHALDAQVLARAAQEGSAAAGGQPPSSAVSAAVPPAASVAHARRQLAADAAAVEREAAECFQKGQRCEAEGKIGAARVYYQQAARRASAPLKQQILARLDALPQTSRAPLLSAGKDAR